MTDRKGSAAKDPVGDLVDSAFESAGRALSGGGQQPAVKAAELAGLRQRKPTPKFGRWVRRNRWRLLAVPAAVAVFAVLVWSVFPLGDLFRGAATWVDSWAGGGRPFGPSRFDDCWAGGPSKVCGPSQREAVRLALLVGGCVLGALWWWRASELPASGSGPLARMCARLRRRRLLDGVDDAFYYACVQMGYVAPPHPAKAALARIAKAELRPKAAAALENLRVDMTGGVVADLAYNPLADVKRFESDKNVLALEPAMTMRAGHTRRVPAGPRWARPLTTPLALAAGERSTVITPHDIHFGEHPLGGGRRQIRFLYPDLDSAVLESDTDPAPDQRRVRVALSEDVVYWDRDNHAHLGIFGPTNSGKGHILRHGASQVLQVGQYVAMIDGQASGEHDLFKGAPNYWWFDPDDYHDRWGQGLAPWVVAGLSASQATEAGGLIGDQVDRVVHLVYVRNQLAAIAALGRRRNPVYRRNSGPWQDWTAEDQAAHPRVNVFIDEANTLLMKGAGPGKVGEELRREIGAYIGVLLFGVRKYGIHVALAAQILYSASWMARGMYAQIGLVLATGNMPDQHQTMTSEVRPWPKYPNQKGYGVAVAYASPPARAVRFPPAWPKAYSQVAARLREANAVQP